MMAVLAAIEVPLAATAKSGDMIAMQVDAAHSGRTSFDNGFTGPLKRTWSVDLGGAVSYPLIVNGVVYVTVGNPEGGNYGSKLFALSLASGKTIWERDIDGTYFISNAAYDWGRIYVVNSNGVVTAFSADTQGRQVWSVALPFQDSFEAGLTATGGTIYVGGDGFGGNMYALREKDGTIKWDIFLGKGAGSNPAIGDHGVFVSVLCQHYKLSQKTGKILWHIDRGCFGGTLQAIVPVYADGRDYATDPDLREPIVIDSKSGKILSQFDAALIPPAIVDNPGMDPVLIVPDSTDTKVNAVDVNTGAVLWTYNTPGLVGMPVMVINNVVAVGELDGTLALLDVDSGSLVWSTNVGAPIGDIYGDGHPLVGFGAAEGRLVVPAATRLSAYVPQ